MNYFNFNSKSFEKCCEKIKIIKEEFFFLHNSMIIFVEWKWIQYQKKQRASTIAQILRHFFTPNVINSIANKTQIERRIIFKMLLRGETIENLIDFIDIAFRLKLPSFAADRELSCSEKYCHCFQWKSKKKYYVKKYMNFSHIFNNISSEIICHYVEDY